MSLIARLILVVENINITSYHKARASKQQLCHKQIQNEIPWKKNKKPVQCGLHQTQTRHWRPKNHRVYYIDPAAGFHPYTRVSSP